jgi:hypothetical protein
MESSSVRGGRPAAGSLSPLALDIVLLFKEKGAMLLNSVALLSIENVEQELVPVVLIKLLVALLEMKLEATTAGLFPPFDKILRLC